VSQFASAISNAGFGTATIRGDTERVWDAGATLLARLGMLTGGAAGSTVSGLKIDDRRLSEEQVQREYTEATVVLILWLVFLVVGISVFLLALPDEYPLSTSSST